MERDKVKEIMDEAEIIARDARQMLDDVKTEADYEKVRRRVAELIPLRNSLDR